MSVGRGVIVWCTSAVDLRDYVCLVVGPTSAPQSIPFEEGGPSIEGGPSLWKAIAILLRSYVWRTGVPVVYHWSPIHVACRFYVDN